MELPQRFRHWQQWNIDTVISFRHHMFRFLHIVIMQRRLLRRWLGEQEEQEDGKLLLERTIAFPNTTQREASRFPGALVIFDIVWWIFKEYIDLEGKKQVEQPFLFLWLSFPYTLILSLLDSGFVVDSGPLWSTARDVLLSSVVMWERNYMSFLHIPYSNDAGLYKYLKT